MQNSIVHIIFQIMQDANGIMLVTIVYIPSGCIADKIVWTRNATNSNELTSKRILLLMYE